MSGPSVKSWTQAWTKTSLRAGSSTLLIAVLAIGCKPKSSGEDPGSALEIVPPPEIHWQLSEDPVERAPIALTASDGTGLALVSLHARTVIEEPLAFTELHMRFRNPEPRRREGRFEITLPEQAAISRFAMRIGSRMQEGEVVERKRAAQIYEDFLHRKQDPALLEKDAGNEFAARVFPIEPGETKEIILAYSEELEDRDMPYRVRLAGLPALEELRVDVRVGGSGAPRSTDAVSKGQTSPAAHMLRLEERDFAPSGDLEIVLPRQKPMALRSGDLVIARIAPVLDLPPATVEGLTVLVDTSASRALGFGSQLERLDALLKELIARGGRDFEARVLAFDQVTEEVFRGPASQFGLREKSKLLERGALGASNLQQALALLAERGGLHPRVLIVSDGVVTAGASDTTSLREGIAKLAAHGVTRLDVLAEGGIVDHEALHALTRAGLRETGLVLRAREPVGQLASRMLLGVRERVNVHLGGATWVYPSALENLQSGDERLVFAELPEGVPLQLELEGAGAEAFDTLQAPRPLVERAWARAKIAALSAELRGLRGDESRRAELEQRITELSIEHRVLSDLTALLVLETEHDYVRYRIERSALRDILAVGKDGITLMKRGAHGLEIAAEQAKHEEADEERAREPLDIARDELARDEGTLGLRGTGIGGGGRSLQEAPTAKTDDSVRERRQAIPPRPAPAPRPAASAPAASPGAPTRAVAEGAAPQPTRAAPPPAMKSTGGLADLGSLSAADSIGQSGSLGLNRSSGSGSGASKGAPLDMAPSPEPSTTPPTRAPAETRLEPEVRVHAGAVEGLPTDAARSVVRSMRSRALQCWAPHVTHEAASRAQTLALEATISDKGLVSDVFATRGNLQDRTVQSCLLAAFRTLRFPKPDGPRASVQASVELGAAFVAGSTSTAQLATAPKPAPRPVQRKVTIATPKIADAYEGVLGAVLERIAKQDTQGALAQARTSWEQNPGDVAALIALGEALEAASDHAQAARVYGSIIDLFPSRADLRRMAGQRLGRLPAALGGALAVDTYARAVEQRPDHPSGHRLLAYAQLAQGQHEAAFTTLGHALALSFRADRFEGVTRILREDLALIGAAWAQRDPSVAERIEGTLRDLGIAPDTKPSLRFVLSWETDANDVDFHIYDGRGGHAYYQKPKLASGGALYADITTGYGPECFAIPGAARAYPYVLQAHYFARGPMGFGMGTLQAIDHDGRGGLTVSEHPFVIMKDRAFVELARLDKR